MKIAMETQGQFPVSLKGVIGQPLITKLGLPELEV